MKRTWGTRPSPGTLVRFTYGRSPHYFDSTGKRDSVNVRQGEVTMVLGDFREEFPGPRSFVVAGLRLILSSGMVVLLNCDTRKQGNVIDLEPV